MVVFCISDLVWLGSYGMIVVSTETHALEGQEDKTIPREAFRVEGAEGLINERLKLLFFGLHS